MNYRNLTKADLKISEISFGCMSLHPGNHESERLIHRAIDGGINYFDTADLYDGGENETILGAALRGKRERVVVATKVGNELRTDGPGWDWNPTKNYIIKAVEKSLRRLQTDYIDIYQLHGGTINDPIDETIEAFETLQHQGKIRHYGVSSIRPNVIRPYVAKSKIVSNMMQYSLLDRRPEEEVFQLLCENQIGVMVRGGLARGVLAGKSISDYLDYNSKDIDLLLDKVKLFSNEKTSLSHVALQWVLRRKEVTSAVVGIRTSEQLEEALAYEDSTKISVQDLDGLSEVLPPNSYMDHR